MYNVDRNAKEKSYARHGSVLNFQGFVIHTTFKSLAKAIYNNFIESTIFQLFMQKPSPTTIGSARINFAFLESYFSNFIEGTEFDVSEARRIVLGLNLSLGGAACW